MGSGGATPATATIVLIVRRTGVCGGGRIQSRSASRFQSSPARESRAAASPPAPPAPVPPDTAAAGRCPPPPGKRPCAITQSSSCWRSALTSSSVVPSRTSIERCAACGAGRGPARHRARRAPRRESRQSAAVRAGRPRSPSARASQRLASASAVRRVGQHGHAGRSVGSRPCRVRVNNGDQEDVLDLAQRALVTAGWERLSSAATREMERWRSSASSSGSMPATGARPRCGAVCLDEIGMVGGEMYNRMVMQQ